MIVNVKGLLEAIRNMHLINLATGSIGPIQLVILRNCRRDRGRTAGLLEGRPPRVSEASGRVSGPGIGGRLSEGAI